jgi:hypothetical protein
MDGDIRGAAKLGFYEAELAPAPKIGGSPEELGPPARNGSQKNEPFAQHERMRSFVR